MLTYSLTIHNSGPDAATGVRLIDSLPAGGSVSLDQTLNSQGSCLLENSEAISCDLGSLANNATATMTVIVNVSAFAPLTITNTASVASNIGDSAGANNSATQSTTVAVAYRVYLPVVTK